MQKAFTEHQLYAWHVKVGMSGLKGNSLISVGIVLVYLEGPGVEIRSKRLYSKASALPA